MTSFSYAVIASEIFCILVSFVILYGNIYETHRKTDSGLLYSWLVITNIIALVSDCASWLFEGKDENFLILYISNIVSIIAAFFLLALFALYITELVKDRISIHRTMIKAILIFWSVAIVCTFLACVSGKMFTIENGIYAVSSFYSIYSVVSVASLLLDFFVVTKYSKTLGTHDSIAAYIYVILPTISAIINLFFDDFAFTYQATTLSTLILYVMLQSEQADILQEEKQISAYYANHDELTGILSRRAYMTKLEELGKTNGNVGVVYADINGLKYTNDCYGHEEGDKLIKKFSVLLSTYFGTSDIFRISGDEFIAIADNTDEDRFCRKVNDLEQAVCDFDFQIACIGDAYGTVKDINLLVMSAESVMYEKKKHFHNEHPEMQRYSFSE